MTKSTSNQRRTLALGFFAIAATLLVVIIMAATEQPKFEAERTSGVRVRSDNLASDNRFILFGDQNIYQVIKPKNYYDSLSLIESSSFRNKTMDNSPYTNTKSADLYSKNDLFTTIPGNYWTTNGGGYKGEYGGTGDYWQPEIFNSAEAAAFRAECEVSHFSYDDPIVYPGQPEAAHLHMFMGNTHTNAYSTYDSILNSGSSTCNGAELNRTAYWVPAMFDGKGNVVVPFKIRFYYKTESNAGIGKVKTYPENLQIVADNSSNTDPNHYSLSTYICNDIYNGVKKITSVSKPSNSIPSSCKNPAGGPNNDPGVLEYRIFFDHCLKNNPNDVGDWEQNRDTNLVPPRNKQGNSEQWFSSLCPSSHPNLLPALVTHIYYGIQKGEDTSKWFLSSDVNSSNDSLKGARGATAHADWFGGWNKQVNQEWVNNCSNKQGAKCGTGLLETWKGNPNARAMVKRKDWISGPHRIPVSEIYNQMCSQSSSTPLDNSNGSRAGAYCN